MKSMFRQLAEDEGYRQFRNAIILKPGFDFSQLKMHCEKIVYATDGHSDRLDSIREQLEDGFKMFDPNKDVVIPVGNAIVCVMAGQIIQQKLLDKLEGEDHDDSYEGPSYIMGVYLDREYKFYRIYLSEKHPIEEVIT